IKAEILKENLRRIAKTQLDKDLVVHPSPPWHYRNRSRFKVRGSPEFAVGYFRFNSHQLLPVEQCPISSPLINRVLADLWRAGRSGSFPEGIEEIELFANAEDSEVLIEVHGSDSLNRTAAQEIAESLMQIAPEVRGVVVFRATTSGEAKA